MRERGPKRVPALPLAPAGFGAALHPNVTSEIPEDRGLSGIGGMLELKRRLRVAMESAGQGQARYSVWSRLWTDIHDHVNGDVCE